MKFLLTVLFLFITNEAKADCADPFGCVCTNFDNFAGVYRGTVTGTAGDELGGFVRVDEIHLREGRSKTAGPEVDDLIEFPSGLDIGTQVLIEFRDDGSPENLFPVVVSASGQIECPYSKNCFSISPEEALEIKLSNECQQGLLDAGLETSKCKDHGFGCSSVAMTHENILPLLMILAISWLRCRRRDLFDV